MIKTYEHKIPFDLSESFKVIAECGEEIPNWNLFHKDENSGLIEWHQKSLMGRSVSKIRAYLKQQRPDYTLVTLYVNLPLQFCDPFKSADKVNLKLESKLKEKYGTR